MQSPLLHSFILICKLLACTSIYLSVTTHHWVRNSAGDEHRGLVVSCYIYGHRCYGKSNPNPVLWFFFSLGFSTFILELLNTFLLIKRTRSCINLVLEEIAIIVSVLFVLTTGGFLVVGFIVLREKSNQHIDWSFFIFGLSFMLGFIELICSLVRVVSYCRDHSFRSTAITYTSKDNSGSVRIQS